MMIPKNELSLILIIKKEYYDNLCKQVYMNGESKQILFAVSPMNKYTPKIVL